MMLYCATISEPTSKWCLHKMVLARKGIIVLNRFVLNDVKIQMKIAGLQWGFTCNQDEWMYFLPV
jgi:hypothetical protein